MADTGIVVPGYPGYLTFFAPLVAFERRRGKANSGKNRIFSFCCSRSIIPKKEGLRASRWGYSLWDRVERWGVEIKAWDVISLLPLFVESSGRSLKQNWLHRTNDATKTQTHPETTKKGVRNAGQTFAPTAATKKHNRI